VTTDVCPTSEEEIASTSEASPFTLEASSSLQTPGWYAALAPLEGAGPGAFARVHGFGDVAATDRNGKTLWSRGSMSFYEDWGLDPWIVPFVVIGADPINPRTLASENPFAVGDVTGDGTDDVIVAHYIRLRKDGKASSTSALTVLDGRNGKTRWTRLYPGVITHVVVTGDTVVIAQETGDVAKRPPGYDPSGEDGSTSQLQGFGFEWDDDRLEADHVWRFETGMQWTRWLAAQPAGDGLVAASWMDKPLGAVSGTPGHTVLVEAATGSVRWQHEDVLGYPRLIRFDPGRSAIVVAEEADPLVGEISGSSVDYPYRISLVALDLGSGQAITTVTRDNSILLSLQVANVAGSQSAEWLVGDVEVTDYPNATSPSTGMGLADYIVAGRVSALDPDAGSAVWTRQTRCQNDLPFAQTCDPLPYNYGLQVAGSPPVVVAASLSGASTGLRGLSGSSGAVLWDRAGDPAFPLFLASAQGPDGPTVLAATPSLVQRSYDVRTGETVMSSPIPYDLHAVDAVDLDHNGTKELIAGGASGAVFAIDVSNPESSILWATEVDGAVHKVEVVDLGSDGRREIVAANSSGITVLDLDGDLLPARSITYPDPNDYVWTFTTGDVNGDGRTDLVVPTTALTAYEGRSSSQLWRFAGTNPAVLAYFSEAVVTPDHRVAAQWLTRSGIPFLNARSHQVVTVIDGPTGQVAWARALPSKFGIVDLWRSVAIDPDQSCGPGSTIAFTWDDSPPTTPVGWFARTDFYDSQSGALCFTSGPASEQIVHMGTVHVPGTGMLEFNWYNVSHLRPDGVTQTHFAEENAAVADVAEADFGPLGKRFLKSWVAVQAYSPTSPTGADGDNPAELASWGDFETGRMLVEDLDGDGVDEVVTMPFDWTAYATVASFSSVGVFSSSFNPHGIAVLEAR
jgi:hypothetical protein